jgi:ABC-2 type transport system permease protein
MSVLPFIVRKEFLQLRRDRRMLPIVFLAPVIQLVLLGYAADLDVEKIPAIVVDADRSPTSRALTETVFAGGVFVPARVTGDTERALESGSASVILSIPDGFDQMVTTHVGQPSVQLIVDGTNSTEGIAAVNYGRAVIAEFSSDIAGGRAEQNVGRVRVEPRVWYNPELESQNYMVPGILALLLMVITMLLSSLAIVKEKELGTLEQLNVTPIRSGQLILGKLTPFIVIGFVDVTLVVLVSQLVFRVPLTGSVFLLFAMSTVFLATTLGLGLLVSTVSDNQQQAMMTSLFFVMLPMFFLSGFAFPIESMPRVIQWVSYLLPLRYYFVIIRGIFLKGAGLATLWDEGLAMVLFGAAILSLAVFRFRKRSV